MNLKEYKKIVSKHSKKEDIFKNVIVAFLVGGLMGVIGELIFKFFSVNLGLTDSESFMYLMIVLAVVSSILTGLGFFDKIVSFAKCGLIIPTTGFAHAMTSSAMDHRSEGLIKGIGSNIFKMTGSIILYGLVSAFFFAIIKGVVMWQYILKMPI